MATASGGASGAGGGGSGAPADATFITKTASGSLSAEIPLDSLSGPGMLQFAADGTPTKATIAETLSSAGILRWRRGANLSDSDQTIQPATDLCSDYHMITATATRNVTIGNTSAVTLQYTRIVNRSNQSLVVKNNSGSTLTTLAAASGGAYPVARCYFNGVLYALAELYWMAAD